MASVDSFSRVPYAALSSQGSELPQVVAETLAASGPTEACFLKTRVTVVLVIYLFWCACECGYTSHSTHVEVREQLSGVDSLLSPCGF